MIPSAEDLARTAAAQLAPELDAALPAYVERQLQAGAPADKQFLEPGTTIALASLLVSIAGLAWQIYRDLAEETTNPSPEVIKTRVRVALEEPPAGTSAQMRDRLLAVVVEHLRRAL